MVSLQRTPDQSEAPEYSQRGFNTNEPPPPYSSADENGLYTPSFVLPRMELDDDELTRRPLTDEELYRLGHQKSPYDADQRYFKEFEREKERILNEDYMKIDEDGRRLYCGPDLIGDAGWKRLSILARHNIKAKWQGLGVWNEEWAISGAHKRENFRRGYAWQWPWHNDDEEPFWWKAYIRRNEKWPAMSREGPNHREIRKLLENKGHWGDRSAMVESSNGDSSGPKIPPAASLVTSRPWYKFDLQVAEEQIRLERSHHMNSACEKAKEYVKARWQAQGIWESRWEKSRMVGWRWKDECPSPTPAAVDDMELTPSEKDAMEDIEPDEPHAPLLPNPGPPYFWLKYYLPNNARRADGITGSSGEPSGIDPAIATQNEPEDKIGRERANGTNHVMKGAAQASQKANITSTRRTDKRKRQDDVGNEDTAFEADGVSKTRPPPASGRVTKRLRFDDTDQMMAVEVDNRQPTKPTSHRNVPVKIVSDGNAPTVEVRSGPRRSARIEARKGTVKSTIYDDITKSKLSTKSQTRTKSSRTGHPKDTNATHDANTKSKVSSKRTARPKSTKTKTTTETSASRDGLQRTTGRQTRTRRKLSSGVI